MASEREGKKRAWERRADTQSGREAVQSREETEDGDEELTLDSGKTWISVFIVFECNTTCFHLSRLSRSVFVCRDELGMWGKIQCPVL